jgi:hypothetical protein
MPTLTVLLTVAPEAGAVKAAASGEAPFWTVTPTLPLPELPPASRTVATRVRGPLGVLVVVQGSVTWVAVALSVHTVAVPTVSV